jgi:hypothetical protein
VYVCAETSRHITVRFAVSLWTRTKYSPLNTVVIFRQTIWFPRSVPLTLDEARELIVDGINYAAYKETESSLHDSDKNRLFGSQRFSSEREVIKPSPWSEGDFEEKMATLLHWANMLNRSVAAFTEAQRLLENEDSVIGRVIRRSKSGD